MGIRISKDLGYGIDTLATKKGKHFTELADERIDTDKLYNLINEADELDGRKLLNWLKKEEKELTDFHWEVNPCGTTVTHDTKQFEFEILWRQLESMNKKGDLPALQSGISHQDEYGLANVIQFIPITCPSWHRYDDIIDYTEESNKPAGQINYVTRLKGSGIYPWNGRMIRYRDPKPGVLKDKALKEGVTPGMFQFLDATVYSQLVGWWDPNIKPIAGSELLKHLQEDYRPAIPMDVTMLVWFVKDALKDLKAFYNELRPMIYVSWG